ncbi:MAG TPA: electron transfer flavoprotein subunit alpha/FixB family protein [Bryobacteraceae bacterium]|nr:electron transfer flavoprotein subunit alpha/FixB family protein [Bryobacteraceae bacterium]
MTGSICVLAEQWRGRISDVTYETLAFGREAAGQLGVPLTAILVGSNLKELAQTLGAADSVVYVDHALLAEPVPQPYAEALAQVLADSRPLALLAPLTNVMLGVSTLLAIRLGVAAVNFCKDIKVVDGRLRAVCVMYGGKIEAEVETASEPAILGIWPGARPADKGRSDRTPPVEEVTVVLEEPAVRLKRYVDPEAGDVDLTRQEVLVAVGRGIQSRDNLGLAEDLAKTLGGAVAGSRPVIDQGWLPMSRQIGKSGLTVKPKLYVALGISGAPEHIEGMKDSGIIVAVNSDPRAPIFNVAHYGIVADVVETLPSLTAAIESKRAAAHHA